MIFALIHLFLLVFSPQNWWGPLLNLPVDYIIFPLWFIGLVMTNKFKNLKLGTQEKFFIAWVLWIVISLTVNGKLIDNFYDFVFYYSKWFVLFIFLSLSFDSVKDVHRYYYLIMFLGVILCFEGISHYYSEDGIGWAGQPLGWSNGPKGRTQWVGIFDGPGVFCVIYTTALPFILALFHKDAGFFKRISSLLLSALFLFSIYINGSRGGMLATFGIIAIHNYVLLKRFKILVIPFAIALVVIFTLLPSHITNMSDSHHSTSHRVEMWAEGCEMVKYYPVFGIGRGEFPRYSGSLIAHNSAVEIMGETGIPGLFLWIGLIYFSIKKIIYYLKNFDPETDIIYYHMAKALLVSIMGYIMSSMFVTLEYETFYMLLALCAIYGRNNEYKDLIEKWDLKIIFSLTILFVVFINIFTILFGPGYFL